AGSPWALRDGLSQLALRRGKLLRHLGKLALHLFLFDLRLALDSGQPLPFLCHGRLDSLLDAALLRQLVAPVLLIACPPCLVPLALQPLHFALVVPCDLAAFLLPFLALSLELAFEGRFDLCARVDFGLFDERLLLGVTLLLVLRGLLGIERRAAHLTLDDVHGTLRFLPVGTLGERLRQRVLDQGTSLLAASNTTASVTTWTKRTVVGSHPNWPGATRKMPKLMAR